MGRLATVTNLDHDGVDEDRGVNRIQWPVLPRGHLFQHPVGDP